MNIRRLIKSAAAVLSLVVALGGSVTFFRGCIGDASPMGRFHNRYEAAQHSTVLVTVPDGQGTGVVVRRGDRIFVWTAAHVVGDFRTLKISTVIRYKYHRVGATEFKGRVIAVNAALDVALLYVDAPPQYFNAAEFDDLIPPPVGSAVYHVGNFLGADFDNSVSAGVISQHGAEPLRGAGWPWLVTDQTTCSVLPGSSGGPMFNAKNNKVLGIVVATFPGTDLYLYVPVRAIEVWAQSAGIAWAIRGDTSPDHLTFLPEKPKDPIDLIIKLYSVD